MFIDVFKNNGTDYLRLTSSKRVLNKHGQKVSVKKVICNLGPLSRFDDGEPDYVKRLRESFRQGAPLIEELRSYTDQTAGEPERYCLHFTSDTEDCLGHPKHYSHMLLDRILDGLGITRFFTQLKSRTKIEYDLLGLLRLLVFGRILNPESKLSTFEQNKDYYEALTSCTNVYNIYDILDVIYENKEKIIRCMNASITKNLGRNPKTVFYDVTNFFFEIEEPDADYEEDGEIVTGLRKKGVSKEHRDQPIVQMSLFMDDMGIPISIEVFPGNTLDQATLRPALKSTMEGLEFSRFILVADRGLCSYKNILHLIKMGHGYIVSKSIKKTRKQEREWMLDSEGYVFKNEDFRYKSRIIQRTVTDENGVSRTLTEKVIVYWSRRFYEREIHEHRSFLEFIAKLKETPASFRVTAAQAGSLKRFFKKDVIDKETGEVLDSRKLMAMIDEEKLEEYTAFMGYYQLVTSELDMDVSEVIDKYHGLSRIEDQFRVLKGNLETRPVFVRTKAHIEAHLIVCLIALTILRIIQKRIADSGILPATDTKCWTSGLTGEQIQNALRKWQVEIMPDSYYRFNDLDDPDLMTILEAYEIDIPRKLFSRAQLKSIKTSMKVFD